MFLFLCWSGVESSVLVLHPTFNHPDKSLKPSCDSIHQFHHHTPDQDPPLKVLNSKYDQNEAKKREKEKPQKQVIDKIKQIRNMKEKGNNH